MGSKGRGHTETRQSIGSGLRQFRCVVLLHFGFGELQEANLDVTDDLFLIW